MRRLVRELVKRQKLLVLKAGGMQKLSNDNITVLDGIYKEELEYGKNHDKLNKLEIEVD